MVVLSERISWRTKGFLAMSTAAWLTLPISTLNLYLSQQFPFSLGIVLDFGLGFLGAMGLFSYAKISIFRLQKFKEKSFTFTFTYHLAK